MSWSTLRGYWTVPGCAKLWCEFPLEEGENGAGSTARPNWPAGGVVQPFQGDSQHNQHRRISIRLVQQIFQRLREKCNLDTPATPHSCRHFFATQLVERTQDVVSVSRLLGHTRVQTTMVYQHSSPDRLASVVRALEATPS